LENATRLDPIQPRFLRYRNHYKIYVLGFMLSAGLIFSYWGMRFHAEGYQEVFKDHPAELALSCFFFIVTAFSYLLWLRPKMSRSVQVFPEHVLIHNGKSKDTVRYNEIESVSIVCWSIFYVKTKDGIKHYFNSSLERVDYIWEGIFNARPDLIPAPDYEEYRVKLVQYDHHQKRKEWFFKHKLVDIFNWGILPAMFITLAFIFQSKQVVIHQQGLYFFRLFMFSMLVLLATAFLYSIILKKLIFDKKVIEQMEKNEDKVRDLEFEGVVLQRSKIFQLATASFVLATLIKLDINLYSISKVKEDIASFNLKKGSTLLVDNRFNCVGCKYQLNDGDLVIFGKGLIGQVLAKEGDMVGQIAQDAGGRMIASENIQEVPRGHVAIKAANGRDIIFIQIHELIGKIQK
jgi:hypothetical protein